MKWEKLLLGSSIFNLDIPSQPNFFLHPIPWFLIESWHQKATVSPNWWLHTCTFTHPIVSSFGGVASKVVSSLYVGSKQMAFMRVFEFGAIKDEHWMHSFKKRQRTFGTVHWRIFLKLRLLANYGKFMSWACFNTACVHSITISFWYFLSFSHWHPKQQY